MLALNFRGENISLLSSEIEIPPRPTHSTFEPLSSSLSSPKTPSLCRSGSSDSRATSLPSPPATYNATHLLHPALTLPAPEHKYTKFATGASYQPFTHQQQQLRPLYVPTPSYYHYRSHGMDQFGNVTNGDLAQQLANFQPVYDQGLQQGLHQQQQQQQPPPVFDNPYTQHQSQQPQHAPLSQQEPEASGSDRPKKKSSYPCPVGKQYGCNEFFTTSGHAARHAKKHTGKKDAICPECNKAFTRKDNMEQHRRTHSTIRGQAKAAAVLTAEEKQARKARQAAKKMARESSIQATAAAAAATAANAAMPTMGNMMGMSMGMQGQQNMQYTSNAPMSMEMATMLDPRLMGNQQMGQHHQQLDTFTAEAMASFQAQLQAANAVTGGYRSSYDQGMQAPSTPDSMGMQHEGQQQEAHGSPTRAPALDALALAASRQ